MNNINWALMTRETLWMVIKISLPFLLGTLLVGLIVSIVQVVTQIQEPTLTFLPKFILVIGLIMFLLPWICQTFSFYAFQLYDNIRIMGHQI